VGLALQAQRQPLVVLCFVVRPMWAVVRGEIGSTMALAVPMQTEWVCALLPSHGSRVHALPDLTRPTATMSVIHSLNCRTSDCLQKRENTEEDGTAPYSRIWI